MVAIGQCGLSGFLGESIAPFIDKTILALFSNGCPLLMTTEVGSGRRDFVWTTGGDENIEHMRLIDTGATGEVHQVTLRQKDVNIRC